MDVILTTVAGIDVHKEKIAITVLKSAGIEKPTKEQFECSTFTQDLEVCAEKLVSLGVKHVVMESTGVYWKPIYNVFIKKDLIITLGNAAHIKNVPGRKTDMNDSFWLAYLHRHGFVKPSFIPEEKFQDLRLITRHRNTLLSEQSRIKNRVQKILEDGNVKLSVVINDIFGVSGLAVLKLIAKGETDPKKLCNAVTTNVKKSKEEIIKGLYNCLRSSHCFLIETLLLQYENNMSTLRSLEKKIDELYQNDQDVLNRLTEIPGISAVLAENILAEATTGVAIFENDRKFAAWAGVAPGNNESANKKKRVPPVKGTCN